MNSLTKRRVPRACSSITKAKMTSCVPRSGMSVRVDLASLERERDHRGHSGHCAQTVLSSLCLHHHLPVSAESWTLFPEIPQDWLLQGVGDGGRGQDFKSPGAAKNRVRGKVRGYKPCLDGKRALHRVPNRAPQLLSLLEGKAEGAPPSPP